MKKTFYITTTAPYVNAEPHIGFALEIIQADVLARYKRLSGFNVAFGYGTDEHGLKIYRKATEQKKSPQSYCDEFAHKYVQLQTQLNLSTTHFIRTTDTAHIHAAQEFWMRCYKNDDIYKKNYTTKYCVGCELEKTDSELQDNKCPIHPHMTIELVNEENYFFRFSKYQKHLLDLYSKEPNFVYPQNRLLEIKTFVEKGLQDFSVSRLKSKMPWGVEVPNDSDHVMYVWFDALIFYISTLGWPNNTQEFRSFWPGIQLAGKDNLRQQSAIWQAMLLSAGISPSRQIRIHGFITSNGQKMSKSMGNVVDPISLIKQYGLDPVRYYLLKEIPTFDDGNFSHERMKEIYNTDLANELGNLVSRITTLASVDKIVISTKENNTLYTNEMTSLFEDGHFDKVIVLIWKQIKDLNKQVNSVEPWKKTSEQRKDFLYSLLSQLFNIGHQLKPFMPQTAEKIIHTTNGDIQKSAPLFPRLS